MIRIFILTVVFFAFTSSLHVYAQTDQLRELNAGTSAVQDIHKQDKYVFEISLGFNQLLQITIVKGDLRLAAALFAPDGRKLAQQESHDFETMSVLTVSQMAGKYRLEITSLEVRDGGRQFTLKVENLRTASAVDLKRVAAHESRATASVSRAKWEKEPLLEAIRKYKEASSAWKATGDTAPAVRALMDAASVHVTLGEHRNALALYQAAASDAARARDALAEAEAFSQIGRLQSLLGKNDEAIKFVTKALAFFTSERRDDRPSTFNHAYAAALTAMGEVSYSKGDFVRASSSFAQALKISEAGDRKAMARARLFTGYIAGGLGEAETAAAHITDALAIYREVGDRSGEGSCLTALALFYSFKRNDEVAIKMHQDAGKIFRDIGDRPSEAITFNGLGEAYEQLTEYKLALDYYLQAADLFRQTESFDFLVVTLFQIAGAHKFLGDYDKALEFYEKCIKTSRLAKKTRTAANALKDVAALYAARGEPDKALRQYRQTLSFFRSIDDHRGLSIALNNFGDFLLTVGDEKQALSTYRDALQFAERTGEKRIQISVLYGLARTARHLGLIDEAKSSIKRSVDLIEEVRGNLLSPDFRTSYFSVVRKHYELYIDILMSLDQQRPGQGFAAAALSVSESARARSLVDLLIEAKADIRQEADPQLIKRERELEALLRAEAQYQLETQGAKLPSEEIDERNRQLDNLRAEYQKIQGQVRDRSQRYLDLVRSRSIALPQIQHELNDGQTLLLEYALGEEKSYLWLVSKDSLNTYVLPARATLEQMGRDVYDQLTARSTLNWKDPQYAQQVEAADQKYLQKARDLSRMLLGDAQKDLGNKRLLVVTEGMLQYVPFDALPLPTPDVGPAGTSGNVRFVIDSNEVVTLPSMSTLAVIRAEQRRTPAVGKVVAVFADPVFDVDDERVEVSSTHKSVSTPTPQGSPGPNNQRLARTAAETEAILKEVPKHYTIVATGFDATREALTNRTVEDFEIVHLATHGVINAEHPELSGILLGMVDRKGQRIEGFLTLNDIYRLSLSARLTVLSACETALGKNVQGEGLVGLTRGFMFAGSKSVVASLWKVDDRATAELMGDLYKHILREGLSPAAGLRAAKFTIKQQKAWQAPYFWAGFTLQGEYNQTIAVPPSSEMQISYVLLALGVLTVGCLLLLRFRRRR
jgi:CHAT domain-containing protein/tetratricopeptide (TPR) repeat protein